MTAQCQTEPLALLTAKKLVSWSIWYPLERLKLCVMNNSWCDATQCHVAIEPIWQRIVLQWECVSCVLEVPVEIVLLCISILKL